MEEWAGMEYHPVQLARSYRFVRDERTDVEDGDMRTWSQQYVKEERAMQTGKTVADMVKAVSLQPAIQVRRIIIFELDKLYKSLARIRTLVVH